MYLYGIQEYISYLSQQIQAYQRKNSLKTNLFFRYPFFWHEIRQKKGYFFHNDKPEITMKRILLIVFSGIFIFSLTAQETKNTIPSVTIRNLEGAQVNTSDFSNDGKPFIISFWATYCKPCVREFNSLTDVYEEWQEETGVKLFAISIDDSRTSNNVLPFVNGKGWEFDFYLDINGDFKRAMNVNLVPHTFICNGNGEIVWQHTSFAEGGELEMLEVIRGLTEQPK
jgi:cytochrome c biogenesis protein CcmG, thiol:disulfide interchange protein DsbE